MINDKVRLIELKDKIKKKCLSVLFVEDNEAIRLIMHKSLDMIFSHTDIVSDGIEALDKLNERKYDLVITDINMPNCDGSELIQEIRKRCKIFPIIITTAHAEFKDIYANQPNIIVIDKPYSIIEVMEALDKFEESNAIIEDTIYEKLEQSYEEAKKVLDMINNRFKG